MNQKSEVASFLPRSFLPSDVLNFHWKRFICTAEFSQVRSLNLYVYYLRMHYPQWCPRVVCSLAIWKIQHIPGASLLTRAAERIRDSVCVDLRLIDLFTLAKMQWWQKSSGISVARHDMLASFPKLLFLSLFFFFFLREQIRVKSFPGLLLWLKVLKVISQFFRAGPCFFLCVCVCMSVFLSFYAQ